ncbi:type VI secretion protein ClpV [Salmonella enterica subsp. arizonae]|uniref:Type VI secretion protein ClpV n=1 Tax=Salmonella enterica subsp. arizonae TaxID=59203 RepID=A0A447R4J1_SALER|nr:type VI secretion protein ClpV [Salmonella enterica subsp. arizonae]
MPKTENPGAVQDDTVLNRFTVNVTARASEGKIDPVFGRDNEIRQMVDILSRRRKNNPILVGEPGVGKTALVEGLALRIAEEMSLKASGRSLSEHWISVCYRQVLG